MVKLNGLLLLLTWVSPLSIIEFRKLKSELMKVTSQLLDGHLSDVSSLLMVGPQFEQLSVNMPPV